MPVNSFDDYPMSWRPKLDRSERALYKTLARQLEEDIASGLLKPGTKLPPQRELADYLDINVSTVVRAFQLCERNGLLSATVGSGTFVAYDAQTPGRLMQEKRAEVRVDLSGMYPTARGNEVLLELMKEMLNEPGVEALFGYYGLKKEDWQKKMAVEFLKELGHETCEERILISGGGQNGLTAVLTALFRPGDRIAVNDHTYPGIKTSAAMLGIRLVPVEQDEEGMKPDALEFVCKNEEIKGVYLIPTCHNPTTATMGKERRDVIARVIKRYGCVLIEDGTFQPTFGRTRSLADRIPEQTIYIASLSKGIAPGLRLSYLSVPSKYKKSVSDALYNMNITVVPMMAELVSRMIASEKYKEILEVHRFETRLRNKIVDQYLSPEICFGRSDDIFRWLRLPEGMSGEKFRRTLETFGIRVYEAEMFSVGNTIPERAVRLSICTPKNREDLEWGIQTIAELLGYTEPFLKDIL